jgi:hypothetical protein
LSDPIGAVLESLLGDGFALALSELKADSNEGRRHLEPVRHGVTPLLFVRERAG